MRIVHITCHGRRTIYGSDMDWDVARWLISKDMVPDCPVLCVCWVQAASVPFSPRPRDGVSKAVVLTAAVLCTLAALSRRPDLLNRVRNCIGWVLDVPRIIYATTRPGCWGFGAWRAPHVRGKK